MLTRVLRFNTYLLAVLAVAAGCQTDKNKDEEKDKEKSGKKGEASLRVHLEVNSDGSDRSGPVSIGRKQPFQLNVEKTAFLNEFQIEKASVVDTFGGFSISVQFDKVGGWLLEQYTTANKGKHLAISAEFGEMRWLAAPKITQRLGEGRLVFTPDATREEAERIVDGVNRVAKRAQK
jgi:preprotein translocase subunit SecD